MQRSRFRPFLQTLESRRLLAADAAMLEEVSEIVAADVNADGSVTALDALEIINELNASEIAPVGESVSQRVDAILDRLDVDGDGRLSAVDALRVINRINSDDVDLVDSVLRSLPAIGSGFVEDFADAIANEVTTPIRESVRGLIDQLNVLRRDVNLPRQTVSDVIGEIAGIVSDSELSSSQRTDAILGRVENIVELVGIDGDDVSAVSTRVREVIDSLPDSLTDRLDDLSPEILGAAERIVDSLDGGLSLSSIGDIVDNLSGLQLNLRLPSISSVFEFVDVYRQTTADRSFTTDELRQLRESAGSVLSSAGVEGELRDDLLDGFDRIIRLRF